MAAFDTNCVTVIYYWDALPVQKSTLPESVNTIEVSGEPRIGDSYRDSKSELDGRPHLGTSNQYLKSNGKLRLDYVFGLRAGGLVVYGFLPSSLAAIGVIDVPGIDPSSKAALIPLLGLATAPALIMLLLVRQRLSAWYLMPDYIWWRSVVITLAIFLLSSLVAWCAGLLDGKFPVPWTDAWPIANPGWSLLLEVVLNGVVVLIASSALFMAAIKEDGGLPLLPSKAMVEKTTALKDAVIQLKIEPIWSSAVDPSKAGNIAGEVKELAEWQEARVGVGTGNRELYRMIASDAAQLEEAVAQMRGAPSKWNTYFEENSSSSPTGDSPDRPVWEGMQRLKGLPV